jgi:hypothetical protein
MIEVSHPAAALRGLANNTATPDDVAFRLTEHPSANVRTASTRSKIPSALGSWSEFAPDELIRLAGDPDAEIRKLMIQRWPEPPPDIVRAWLTDEDDEVRTTAMVWIRDAPPPDLIDALLADPATSAETLKFVDLTPELIERFAASADDFEQYRLAGHPGLPADVARRLAGSDQEMFHIGLLMNEVTPADVRAELFTAAQEVMGTPQGFTTGYYLYNAWRDSKEVLWLRDAPLEKRLRYLDSPYGFLRTIVATGKDLPPWAVEKLMSDSSALVQNVTAAFHDSVPGAALEKLFREHGDLAGFKPTLTEHPCFPADALIQYAHSTDARLRARATDHAGLPAELVEILATDSEPNVRSRAAAHPGISAWRLGRLLADPDEAVVEAAAASPVLPVPYMHAILDQ